MSVWISFCTLADTEDGAGPRAYHGDDHCPRATDYRKGMVDLAHVRPGLPRSTEFVRLGVVVGPGEPSATVVLDPGQVREIVAQLSGWLQAHGWAVPAATGKQQEWAPVVLPRAPGPLGS